ncbi:hypothetical protein AGOR_G00249360 [Albula goreensis]|uniref:Ig-like domain-containing protein n=1 Tax=Albula goreensis TaxID=1534307 RepID=A0A8T3CEP1_9TELE|nr:hypothetical protein AGOR_G00249360 [Albula goreensis]
MRRRNSVWLIVLTVLAIPLPAATIEHFSVSVPSGPVSVWLGDSVTLPCSVTPHMDVRPMEVRWYLSSKHHNPILLYKDHQIQPSSKNQQYQGRVSLLGLESGVGGLEVGNASLILTDVTALDSGKYECYVGSDQWYETGLISLQVKNVGSIPVLSVYPSNKEEQVNVSCMSQNWSPQPRVTWRDDKGTELKNQKSSYTTDSHGLVTLGQDGWQHLSLFCSFSLLAIAVLSVLFIKSRRKGPKEPERNDTELEKSSSVPITGSNTEVKEKDKHPSSSAETKALLVKDKRNKTSKKVNNTLKRMEGGKKICSEHLPGQKHGSPESERFRCKECDLHIRVQGSHRILKAVLTSPMCPG